MNKLRSLSLVLAVLVGLQAFSWAQTQYIPGSGQALAVYNPSNAASVDIVNVISPACDRYRADISLIPATDDVELWIRTDSNGGASPDAGASDYAWATSGHVSNTSGHNEADDADSEMAIGENTATVSVGNAAAEGIFGSIYIDRIGSATKWPAIRWDIVYIDAGGRIVRTAGGGSRLATAAINMMQLLFESGNVAEGKVSVFCQ